MSKRDSDVRSKPALVSIVGSAGGCTAVAEILSRLPENFPAPILYFQHLTHSSNGLLSSVLQYYTALRVRWARDGERLMAGVGYLCPAGSAFNVHFDGSLHLASGGTHP